MCCMCACALCSTHVKPLQSNFKLEQNPIRILSSTPLSSTVGGENKQIKIKENKSQCILMPALCSQHTLTPTHAHTHSFALSFPLVCQPAGRSVCLQRKWNLMMKVPLKQRHTNTHTELLNFTDMAIWQKICFFLCMAAGISGWALTKMNDGKIEMLVEERDAAGRDIEWEGQSERYQ